MKPGVALRTTCERFNQSGDRDSPGPELSRRMAHDIGRRSRPPIAKQTQNTSADPAGQPRPAGSTAGCTASGTPRRAHPRRSSGCSPGGSASLWDRPEQHIGERWGTCACVSRGPLHLERDGPQLDASAPEPTLAGGLFLRRPCINGASSTLPPSPLRRREQFPPMTEHGSTRNIQITWTDDATPESDSPRKMASAERAP